jgi:hypothetical protein
MDVGVKRLISGRDGVHSRPCRAVSRHGDSSPDSNATKHNQPPPDHESAIRLGRGGYETPRLARRHLKIGRSAVRPRPWPPSLSRIGAGQTVVGRPLPHARGCPSCSSFDRGRPSAVAHVSHVLVGLIGSADPIFGRSQVVRPSLRWAVTCVFIQPGVRFDLCRAEGVAVTICCRPGVSPRIAKPE